MLHMRGYIYLRAETGGSPRMGVGLLFEFLFHLWVDVMLLARASDTGRRLLLVDATMTEQLGGGGVGRDEVEGRWG